MSAGLKSLRASTALSPAGTAEYGDTGFSVSSLMGLVQFLLRLPRTDVLGYTLPSLRDSVQCSYANLITLRFASSTNYISRFGVGRSVQAAR